MPEQLTLDQPFPSLDGLAEDAYSLRIISPAYASPTGELNAVLQYVYHSFYFEKCGKADIAKTLMSLAVVEMSHLRQLGRAILALGAPPTYCRCPYSGFDYYSAKYVAYSRSLKFMLEDDLLGERQAVRQYGKMAARLQGGAVKDLILRIRADEELHVSALEKILQGFGS